MTVRAEAFLDLEKALTQRIMAGWDSQARVLLPRIYAALQGGNKALAMDLINSIDLSPIVRANKVYFRQFGYMALLFGATRLTNKAKDTIIASGVYDTLVDRSVQALGQQIINHIQESIKEALVNLSSQLDQKNPTTPFGPREEIK